MTLERQNLGRFGEKIAKNYLKSKDYKILALNYKKKWGEIDIIARPKDDPKLVFIEVKTEARSTVQKFGSPEEKVNPRKRKKLIRLAQAYLRTKNYPSDTNWQIDIISIQIDKDTRVATLKHIKNAITDWL